MRYALQLSLYQYIIEKYYGMKVSVEPSHRSTPQSPSPRPRHGEGGRILDGHVPRKDDCARSTRERPKRPAFKCSLSDRIVMTAVRDAQGKLYEKKIAMLNGIDFSPMA